MDAEPQASVAKQVQHDERELAGIDQKLPSAKQLLKPNSGR
jgi:hypothetical protein